MTYISTDPERARSKSDHAASEAGLLPFGGHALVHALAEPDIGLHVPGVKQDLHVGCKFNGPHYHIGSTVPASRTRGTETSESKTSQNRCALYQCVEHDGD